MVLTLSVLLYFGGQIYQKVPPFPIDVKTDAGEIVFSKQQMLDGQDVWRQLGGMEMGTVWGHARYLSPPLLERHTDFGDRDR
ncbi:MAG: nitric oxide reductase subunit B [Gammaproteobacteria bacterium]|jgi:nitric oxide reductase subunit B